MSESDYRKAVLQAYETKKAAGLLSAELLSPTPGNIKTEVLNVCEQRFSTKDEKTLRSFYGAKDNKAAYYKAIDTTTADKFRPLEKVLKKGTLNTALRNIDLLAWLIDFKPRPFDYTLGPIETPDDIEVSVIEPPMKVNTVRPVLDMSRSKTKKQNSIALLVAGLTLVIGLGTYLFFKDQTKHYTGKEGCMIWSDDHYELVDCNDHASGQALYPVKHELVDHFKKITDPKTLTLASVGKVWYAKYNGNVEFFTDSGPYPLDTNRRVLPMSVHILQKYVFHVTN